MRTYVLFSIVYIYVAFTCKISKTIGSGGYVIILSKC